MATEKIPTVPELDREIDESKNRIQTKFLSSGLSSGQTIADWTFNNLVIGKLYVVTITARANLNNGFLSITSVHTGAPNNTVGRLRMSDDGGDISQISNELVPFIATNSTISFSLAVGGGATLEGSGTAGASYVTVKEMNDSELTTDLG